MNTAVVVPSEAITPLPVDPASVLVRDVEDLFSRIVIEGTPASREDFEKIARVNIELAAMLPERREDVRLLGSVGLLKILGATPGEEVSDIVLEAARCRDQNVARAALYSAGMLQLNNGGNFHFDARIFALGGADEPATILRKQTSLMRPGVNSHSKGFPLPNHRSSTRVFLAVRSVPREGDECLPEMWSSQAPVESSDARRIVREALVDYPPWEPTKGVMVAYDSNGQEPAAFALISDDSASGCPMMRVDHLVVKGNSCGEAASLLRAIAKDADRLEYKYLFIRCDSSERTKEAIEQAKLDHDYSATAGKDDLSDYMILEFDPGAVSMED